MRPLPGRRGAEVAPACQALFEQRASRLQLTLIAGQFSQSIDPVVAGPHEIPLRRRGRSPELGKVRARRRVVSLLHRQFSDFTESESDAGLIAAGPEEREALIIEGPGGRVVFVEYRKEDPRVPIKEVHKMSLEQLEKEMRVVGLTRVRTVETLPLQHIVIFEKRE